MRKRNRQENKRSRIGDKMVKINKENKTCEKVRKKKIVLANEKGEKASIVFWNFVVSSISLTDLIPYDPAERVFDSLLSLTKLFQLENICLHAEECEALEHCTIMDMKSLYPQLSRLNLYIVYHG